jgi:hypothetical protein
MHYDTFNSSSSAHKVGNEAIRLARRILQRNPGTAIAVKRHPELAVVAAAAMIRFGSRVLEDLVCRCQGMNELRVRLERAATDEMEGDIIDVDAEVVAE